MTEKTAEVEVGSEPTNSALHGLAFLRELKTVLQHQLGPGALARYRKSAAFEEWRKSLRPDDRLPRGKYFVGQTGGQKPVFVDEYWQVSEWAKGTGKSGTSSAKPASSN